jgi:hypothetical protein
MNHRSITNTVEIHATKVDAQLKWDAMGASVGKESRGVLIYGITV